MIRSAFETIQFPPKSDPRIQEWKVRKRNWWKLIIWKSVDLIPSGLLDQRFAGFLSFPHRIPHPLEFPQIHVVVGCQCGLPEEFDLDVDLEDLEKRRLVLKLWSREGTLEKQPPKQMAENEWITGVIALYLQDLYFLDLFSLWFFTDSIPLDLSPWKTTIWGIFWIFPSTKQANLRESPKIKMTMENQPFEDVSLISYYNY